MRKIFILFAATLLSLNLLARTVSTSDSTHDIVLKVNGDELIGKVTGINDSEIKFIHAGETLEYTIKISDILKITFASGRVEKFNVADIPSEQKNSIQTNLIINPADHHNRIAILPFAFIKDNQSAGSEMSYKAQADAYSYLSKHSAGYTLLDTRTTNALLIKSNITRENMMGFTMEEICSVLGVEYVIDGTITQNKSVATSSTSNNYSSKTTDDNKDPNIKNKEISGNSNSTSSQTYSTFVMLNIYTDKNVSIYTDNHKAFFSTSDQSFVTPLEYLLKRTPLYRK